MKNKKRHFGEYFVWKEEIDSTNEEAKRLYLEGAPHGTVVAAKRQTKGKGRLGRVWESPEGDNIYLSVLLRPKFGPERASMLTLVTALAAAEVLEEEGAFCQIKWPNDLVLNRKKICGILTEMSVYSEGISYVIVGIGVNVNQETFPKEIAHMAGSLKTELNREIESQKIRNSLLERLEKYYNRFEQEGNLGFLLEDYNSRLINIGQQVQILSGEERMVCISQGIDKEGALLVRDGEQIRRIISGEVSVRGLYGYV